MSESEVVGSCSIEGLEGLKKSNAEKGMLLFVSKSGCQGCEEMRGLLKETIGEKLPVIESGVEDKDCLNVAETIGVTVTPTVIYYKNGEEKRRISVDGKKTQDDLRKELREIVA